MLLPTLTLYITKSCFFYNKKMMDNVQIRRIKIEMKKSYQEYISELGKKIKSYRIMKELSQEDLSDKTGISKRSISRLEQGESIQMDNLFKILIALDLGDNIDLLVPDQTRRPSYYLEYSDSGPQRVRKKRVKTTFKWGDES